MALTTHWNSDLWPKRDSIWRDRFNRDWDNWDSTWPKPLTLAQRVSFI